MTAELTKVVETTDTHEANSLEGTCTSSARLWPHPHRTRDAKNGKKIYLLILLLLLHSV